MYDTNFCVPKILTHTKYELTLLAPINFSRKSADRLHDEILRQIVLALQHLSLRTGNSFVATLKSLLLTGCHHTVFVDGLLPREILGVVCSYSGEFSDKQ